MGNSYQPEYKTNPKRLKLKGIGYFGHYAFVILILSPFLLTIIEYIKYLNGTYKGLRPMNELFEGTSIFIFLALILLLIQIRRLKFKTLETNISEESIINLCTKFAKVNNLEVKHVTKNEFVATSNGFLSFGTWGEMITVIIIDNIVYINSICDPYKRPNIVSLGKNKAYRNALKKTIINASA
ncbi:hypothetical protein ACE01N_19980 [Saccharicrinis sp. FJH2]|uniref:hypothetical protein n=1 Tax=Saccharicrinis sp. FJH65 TaxID=3344659 RepID=UPI0035F2BE84